MNEELRSLTGLRGIAALWVLFGHYYRPQPSTSIVVSWLLAHYGLAVDIFMILSGFVLARAYGARLAGNCLGPGFRAFVYARIVRIYPLYALTMLVSIIPFWTGATAWDIPDHHWLSIVENMLMMQSWPFMWPDQGFSGAAWSLSLEWLANLLFAPMALLLLHRSRTLATAVTTALFVMLLALAFLLGDTPEHLIVGQIGWYGAPFSSVRCIPEFMFGMYIWRLRLDFAGTGRLGGSTAAWLIVLLLLPTCLIPTVDVSMDMLFVPLACALVLTLSFEASSVARALGHPVLHWLGTISYSVYLWHGPIHPVCEWLTMLTDRIGLGSPETWGTVAGMVLVIPCSWVSYRWFEMPARRWLRRRYLEPKLTLQRA